LTDPIAEFFHALRSRGHEPLVRDATATVRFDITQGKQTDRWCLGINQGDLQVSSGDCEADCVVGADRSLFNGLISGEVNAMAAMLRGELTVSGDPDLLVLCQRLFPGPPARRDRQEARA
jgi:putative sterol carrier protein